MFVRRRHAVAALVAAFLLTSGCGSPASPPASPTTATTPSPADSDAAAFAAAEATYRAYVDALNAVDLADPSTFEPVYALTTGEVQEADRRSLQSYNSQNVTVSGKSRIVRLEHVGTAEQSQVQLAVCLDVSTIEVRAADGASLVSPDRVPVQSLLVMVRDAGDGRPLITRIEGREGDPTC